MGAENPLAGADSGQGFQQGKGPRFATVGGGNAGLGQVAALAPHQLAAAPTQVKTCGQQGARLAALVTLPAGAGEYGRESHGQLVAPPSARFAFAIAAPHRGFSQHWAAFPEINMAEAAVMENALGE